MCAELIFGTLTLPLVAQRLTIACATLPIQVTYVAFHFVKGTPFDQDQGAYASQTYWEQLDYGKQYTATRKFYTAVPIVLCVYSNHLVQKGRCMPLTASALSMAGWSLLTTTARDGYGGSTWCSLP